VRNWLRALNVTLALPLLMVAYVVAEMFRKGKRL
jgi:hypothetical protein